VIVPHLNQPDYLEDCLTSLDNQTIPRTSFEVLVVDNGSADLPEAVVQRHPGTRLLQETAAGPGMARNRGVNNAKGDVFAFIDADCRANPNWLRATLDALDASPRHTILGGDVRIWRRDPKSISAIEAYESVFAYRFKMYIERQGFSGTGNLAVCREDFFRVGPFRGIDVAEDIDWGRRAKAAGCSIRYVAEMIVYHPARCTIRDLCVKWDRHLQHAINMGDGTMSWRLRWIARAVAVLLSPAVDWVKIASTDRVQGISARLKAFVVLIAVRAYRSGKMISLLGDNVDVMWNRIDSK
jgi:glycosyltransferase involved in cell wall biosynthesis